MAFCNLLGCSPATVLSWLQGNALPSGRRGIGHRRCVGRTKVYEVLRQPEPDSELMKIYNSFAHLTGEYRGKLAQALWEAQTRMQPKGITVSTEEAKPILAEALKKWGFEAPSNK